MLPWPMPPVRRRLTISLAGSTAPRGTAASAGLNLGMPRRLTALFSSRVSLEYSWDAVALQGEAGGGGKGSGRTAAELE